MRKYLTYIAGTLFYSNLAMAAMSPACNAAVALKRDAPFTDAEFGLPSWAQTGSKLTKYEKCSETRHLQNSMTALEQSVVRIGLESSVPLDAMKELNLRTLTIIEAAAKTSLILEGKSRAGAALLLKGRVNQILTLYFGGCAIFPGCVGEDANAIREAFAHGNLRERILLAFYPTKEVIDALLYGPIDYKQTAHIAATYNIDGNRFGFTEHLRNRVSKADPKDKGQSREARLAREKAALVVATELEKKLPRPPMIPLCHNPAAAKAFETELIARAPSWGKNVFENLKAGCTQPYQRDWVRAQYAAGGLVFRKNKQDQTQIINGEFKIAHLVPKLSAAEAEELKRALGLAQVPDDIRWSAGSDLFEPNRNVTAASCVTDRVLGEIDTRSGLKICPDQHNVYYRTAQLYGFRNLVAISGTTDDTLHTGCILGLDTPEQLKELRLAAFTSLVSANHHSPYEILVGGKSYIQDTPLKPTYYQSLLNDKFKGEVEADFKKINPQLQLPEKIVEECEKVAQVPLK